jgi:hypothetical protein
MASQPRTRLVCRAEGDAEVGIMRGDGSAVELASEEIAAGDEARQLGQRWPRSPRWIKRKRVFISMVCSL